MRLCVECTKHSWTFVRFYASATVRNPDCGGSVQAWVPSSSYLLWWSRPVGFSCWSEAVKSTLELPVAGSTSPRRTMAAVVWWYGELVGPLPHVATMDVEYS